MKKQNLLFTTALFLLVMLFACDEDSRGPLVTDSTIPNTVSEVTVENLAGGAKISYIAPTDKDALYIEATFERNGEQVSTRSSLYKGHILIEGLNVTSSQEVTLVVVDRSENRSTPVTTTITPLKSPLQYVYESFQILPAFGGVRVQYDNAFDIRFELLFYTFENGQKKYFQSDFIVNGQQENSIFRTFPNVQAKFGVEAVDRWNNITPIFEGEVTPLLEVKLDRHLMEGIELDTDAPSAFGWVLPNLFDGTQDGSGFHTAQDNLGVIVPPYQEKFHMITIDLGQLATISRMKIFPRIGCCATPFGHGDPRYFEIWGIDEIPADGGADLTSWYRLVKDGEIIKPSDAPLGTHSAEDLAYAREGWETEADVSAPPVRYIRFVNFENWSGTKFMHFMEFEAFGKPE